MKGFLIINIFILTILSSTFSYSAQWEKIGKIQVQDMTIKVFANKTSLKNDKTKKDYKNLWVKLELPKDLKSNLNNEDYRIRKEEYFFNCNKKLFTVSHVILINKDNKVVYDSGSFNPFSKNLDDSWIAVTSNSGPELIHDYICNENSINSITDANAEKQENQKPKKAEKENKQGVFIISGSIVGGKVTDGLDIKRVRWATHEGYERLVFDVYMWGGPEKPEGVETVDEPGHFQISMHENDKILEVQLSGYRSFTAKIPELNTSKLIQKISKNTDEENADDSGFLLSIELKNTAEFRALELHSPARIVLDLKSR